MDDDEIRIIVVPPEIATTVESIVWMLAVEQQIPMDKLKIVSNPFVPKNTAYIIPQISGSLWDEDRSLCDEEADDE